MMSLEIEFFRLEEDSTILIFDCYDDDKIQRKNIV